MKTWIIVLVIFCALLGGIAQVMLKKGMSNFSFKDLFHNIPLFVGIALYGTAFILYNISLKFEDVSLVYPLIALSYVFVVFLAYFVLQEAISINKVLGSFLIVIGVYMISWM